MTSKKKKLAPAGLQRIVVATDFSPGARLALRRAQHLPYAPDAEILLIHVLADGDRQVSPPEVEALRAERMKREVNTLMRALTRLGRGDVRVQAELRAGAPAAELAAAASRRHAGLIVVGRRGESSLRKFLLGSTAEQVANTARRDVLVVGRRATSAYRLPLVALAPERGAHYVLDAAMRILSGVRPRIVTAAHVQMEGWLWGGWSSTREILALRSAAKNRAGELLNAELAPYRERGSRFQLHVLEGEPRQVLLAEVERRHADLLIVGSRTNGLRSRMPVGSVAAQVLRSARCDVLLASAEALSTGANREGG